MRQEDKPVKNPNISAKQSQIDGSLPRLEVSSENISMVKTWVINDADKIKPRANEYQTLFLYATVNAENGKIDTISRNSICETIDSSKREFLIQIDYSSNTEYVTALTGSKNLAGNAEKQKTSLAQCFTTVLLADEPSVKTKPTLSENIISTLGGMTGIFKSKEQIEKNNFENKVSEQVNKLRKMYASGRSIIQSINHSDWQTIRDVLKQFPEYT